MEWLVVIGAILVLGWWLFSYLPEQSRTAQERAKEREWEDKKEADLRRAQQAYREAVNGETVIFYQGGEPTMALYAGSAQYVITTDSLKYTRYNEYRYTSVRLRDIRRWCHTHEQEVYDGDVFHSYFAEFTVDDLARPIHRVEFGNLDSARDCIARVRIAIERLGQQ